jgi:hypothetical protein
MKSTLIVIALALASGLLVASGALASQTYGEMVTQDQQVGARHQIDVMGPEYNKTPSLDWAAAGGIATLELAPAAPRHGFDVMGPEYSATPSLGSPISGGVDTGQMVPAGSGGGIDVMGPEYNKFLSYWKGKWEFKTWKRNTLPKGVSFLFLAHNTSFLRLFQSIQKNNEEYAGERHPKMRRVRGEGRKKADWDKKITKFMFKIIPRYHLVPGTGIEPVWH